MNLEIAPQEDHSVIAIGPFCSELHDQRMMAILPLDQDAVGRSGSQLLQWVLPRVDTKIEHVAGNIGIAFEASWYPHGAS
jgi:hypothetical protein